MLKAYLGIGTPELMIIFFIVVAVAMGFIAKNFGEKKGYSAGMSFAIGFFLGLIGLVIVLLLPDKKKEAADNSSALLNYKQLLDAGAITQEEFDAKKKELLNLDDDVSK